MNPRNGGWLIGLSIIVAMLLACAQLPHAPDWLARLRPDWGIVFFFYWTVHAPGRTGVVSAWLTGFLFDVLLGKPLGLHGVGFATITYLAMRFQPRLAMYTLPQQTAALAVVSAGLALCQSLVLMALLREDFLWTAPLAGVGAAVAYPPLRFVLRPFVGRLFRP